MELRTIIKIDIGEDKSIENCNKIAGEVYQCLIKEDPNLKGIRWNIDLGENKYAMGMFFGFSKSVFVKEVIRNNFPKLTIYYVQLMKEKDEPEDYKKRMNKSFNSASSFSDKGEVF